MDTLATLISFIQSLRQTDGCAWTKEQTPHTLAANTLEECYEFMDAIDTQDPHHYCDELSDLLYHVLLYTEIGHEQGWCTLDTLAQRALDKHHARMPPPTALQGQPPLSAEEADAYWQAQKWKERQAQGAKNLLHGLEHHLPAHLSAYKIHNRLRAASIHSMGQDDTAQRIKDCLNQLTQSVCIPEKEQATHQLGALLFDCISLGQAWDIDPETALRAHNHQFSIRLIELEKKLSEQGRTLDQATVEEIQALR